MTDYQYTQFNKYLSQKGRRIEPAPISRETSVVLRKALGELANEGLDAKSIAKALNLPLAELRALTFGLKVIEGGSNHGTTGKMSPPLTLV